MASSGTIGGWHISASKIYAGGIIGETNTGLLPVCMQVPSKTNSTVFAVGGKYDHKGY
jgi:hypothetical protein